MSEEWKATTDKTVQELDAEVDKVWAQLVASGELEALAKKEGVESLVSAARTDVLRIEEAAEQFDPVTTALVISIGGVVGPLALKAVERVVSDIWKEIILPKLRQRFGAGAAKAVDPAAVKPLGDGAKK